MTMPRCAVFVVAIILSCSAGVRSFCFGGTVPLIDGSTYSVSDNGAFVASSSNSNFPPSYARLSSGEAWCSMNLAKTDRPWIQVTFDKVFEIHQLGVAGHDLFFVSDEVIVNYHVRYGLTNDQPLSVVLEQDGIHPMVFSRGAGVNEVESDLPSPIFAKIVRIEPLAGSWGTASRACVRFEAYGCPAPIVIPVTPTTLSSITPSTTSIALSPTMLNSDGKEEVSTKAAMTTATGTQSPSNTPSIQSPASTTPTIAATTSTAVGAVINTIVLFESDVTEAPLLLTAPVLGILIAAVVLAVIAIVSVLMLVCLAVVCYGKSKKYTRKRSSTKVIMDNSLYEKTASNRYMVDQVSGDINTAPLGTTYSKLDRGSLSIAGLLEPHDNGQDQHIYDHEDEQKQYDYITTPTHIPVVQVPHRPPPSPHTMEDKPLATVEEHEVANPMYNSSDEHTKTSTQSTCAEEDLVYNPTYGQSHR